MAEWRESGLTALKFCAERGFSQSSLYMWSTRFPRQSESSIDTGVDSNDAIESEVKPLVPMARVVRVRDSIPVRAEEGVVRLEVGDVRLYLSDGVQRLTLTTILFALDERAGRLAR